MVLILNYLNCSTGFYPFFPLVSTLSQLFSQLPRDPGSKSSSKCVSLWSGCVLYSVGWGAWADWGDCDDEGLQHRSRHCGEDQEAEASLCQGNVTQSRTCRPHEVPGEQIGDSSHLKYQGDAGENLSFFCRLIIYSLSFRLD